MPRRLISTGSHFEQQIAFSRAVVDDSWIHVAGTTGLDPDTLEISDDVTTQCEQALATIADTLAQAGATLDDVVRVRYLIPERDDFEPCWPLLRAAFGQARPAATMMVVGLADPRMRIEIEVTAHRRGGADRVPPPA